MSGSEESRYWVQRSVTMPGQFLIVDSLTGLLVRKGRRPRRYADQARAERKALELDRVWRASEKSLGKRLDG